MRGLPDELFQSGWYFIEEPVASPGEMIRRLRELSDLGYGDAMLVFRSINNMTWQAYEKIAEFVQGSRLVFHAAFPARELFPPIEEWVLAKGGPGRRAWFGGPGFGVTFETHEDHPVRGHGQSAILLESSAPGDATLRGEFESSAREIFRALGVPEKADCSLLEEPRAVWNDPSGGLELRSMELDRELGGASKIVAYDRDAGAAKLLVRFVELARRFCTGETHVWCPANTEEIGRLEASGGFSGRWVSIDEFSAPTPGRKQLTWDEVFPITDRLSWYEVGKIWMQAASGIRRMESGFGSKRSLRADHCLGGSQGLSILLHVPAGRALAEIKSDAEHEIGVKIGERWPDDELHRRLKAMRRNGLTAAEKSQNASGPPIEEVLRATEAALGLVTGSTSPLSSACDAFLAHSIRGWRGFLMHGGPQEAEAWVETNLGRLKELRPEFEELVKAQQALRTRLAERLGISRPELEARVLRFRGPASCVWTLSEVDSASEEIANRYRADGLG